MRTSKAPAWLKTTLTALAGLGLLAGSIQYAAADPGPAACRKSHVTMSAGTVFNLNNYDPEKKVYLPYPWKHQVHGIVQVSDYGNCRVFFDVSINDGADCAGGHLFCLSGSMTVTTLAGDKLETKVLGWADPDPNDPTGSMFLLHYDVEITKEGTGVFAGARGFGNVEGAFSFSGPERFCEGYAGVATWHFDGVLMLPHPKK